MWRHLSEHVPRPRPGRHVRLHHVHVLVLHLLLREDAEPSVEAGQQTARAATVSLHVDSNVVLSRKTFSTQAALVWFLTRVYFLMILQLRFLWERFITLIALVHVVSSMSLFVNSQMTRSLKGFIAMATFERPLSGMASEMDIEVTLRKESFTTIFAI